MKLTVDLKENWIEDCLTDHIDSSVSVVGLGEFTHGGKEVLLLKIEIIKELIENKGFSVILIEYPDDLIRPVNQYLQEDGIQNDSRAIVSENFNGAYLVEEMVTFIEMLKNYNTAHSNKIGLRGIDVNPDIFPSNAFLIHQYIIPYDYSASGQFLDNENQMSDSAQFTKIYKWAELNHEKLKAKMEGEVYNSFVLDLKNADAAYRIRSKRNTTFIRDSSMAENARFLIKNKKAIVWAHNLHLMKNMDRFKTPNLGHYLDAHYDEQFFNILIDFYRAADLNILTRDKSTGQSVFVSKGYEPKRNSFAREISKGRKLDRQNVLVFKDELSWEKSIRLNQVDMPGNHFTVGQKKGLRPNFDALILLREVHPTTQIK